LKTKPIEANWEAGRACGRLGTRKDRSSPTQRLRLAGTASEPSEQKDTPLSAAADKNGAPGDKLEDTAVVVKDDEVPEIHWVLWSK
jgi:hypothetical protein